MEADLISLSSGLRYKGNVLCDNKVPMSSIISFSYWIGLSTEWLKEVICFVHTHTRSLRAFALYNWFWIKQNFSYYLVEYAADSHFSLNVKAGQVSFCCIQVKSRIKRKEKNAWWTENSVTFSGFLKTFCLFWPLQAFFNKQWLMPKKKKKATPSIILGVQ